MPGGDGTGPLGFGPGSGRGAGFCFGCGRPRYANPTSGRRFWGVGGPAPRFYPGGRVADEKTFLERQAAILKEQIGRIEARLKELENTGQND